jgi:hypothetical protein
MTISGLGVSGSQPLEEPAEDGASEVGAAAPDPDQAEAVARGSAPRNLFVGLTSPDADADAGAATPPSGEGAGGLPAAVTTAVAAGGEVRDLVVGRAKDLAQLSESGKLDLDGLKALLAEVSADGALGAGDLEGLGKLYFGDVGDDPTLRGLVTPDAHEYLGDLVPFGSTEPVLASHLDQLDAVRSAPARLGVLVQDVDGSDLLSILGGGRDNVSAAETGGDTAVARDTPPVARLEVQHDADGYYVFVDVVGLNPSAYPLDELRAALRELAAGDPTLQDVRFVVDAREPITDGECAYFYGPEP